jgi:hypothetical protein
MNRYGTMQMSHWKRTDPARVAAMPDPIRFFSELGEQAETRIQALAGSLAGLDRRGESYLGKVGRLNMARLAAEEQVLAELLIPEPSEPQDTDTEEPSLADDVMAAIQRARLEEE